MSVRAPLILTAATQTQIDATRSSVTEAKAPATVVHVVSFGVDMNDLFSGCTVPWVYDGSVLNSPIAVGTLMNPLEDQLGGLNTALSKLHITEGKFPSRVNELGVTVTEQVKIGLAKLFSGEANSILNNQFLGLAEMGSASDGIVAQLDSKKVETLLKSTQWAFQIFSTVQLRELLAGATAQGINTGGTNPQPFLFLTGDQFNCNVLVTDLDQGPGIVSWPNAQNMNRDLWMFQMRHIATPPEDPDGPLFRLPSKTPPAPPEEPVDPLFKP